MENKLNLIEQAFSDMEKELPRWNACERAYLAEYGGGWRFSDAPFGNRTTRLKAAERDASRLYVPLVKTTVNIVHSVFKTSFMSDRCPIEIKRVGMRSEHDLVLQNALSAALKNKWRKKEHKTGLSKAVLSALYLPLGIVALYYDKTDREIKTKFIPISNLAFDKNASDINDIEYVAHKWKQSVREVRAKIENKIYSPENEAQIFAQGASESERVEMRDLYEKIYDKSGAIKWRLTSYASGAKVREATFEDLPFHFGYCLEAMPAVEESERENHNAVYGSCLPEITRELQKEYNIKRNQRIAMIENQIDPQIAVSTERGSAAIGDLQSRKKYVRIEPNQGQKVSDVIAPIVFGGGTYDVAQEIAMLKSEYEIATGVNSVMTGQTSPSDRRAMGALQTVNASSSMRIESMLQTLMETMLQGYAEHFVKLIYKTTSDEEMALITEDPAIWQKIGTLEERQKSDIDFDLEINFGTTIANDVKINQLSSVLGLLAQNNISNLNITASVLKELLALILGENAPIEAIDESIEQVRQMQEAQAQAAGEQAAGEQAQAERLSPEDEEIISLANGGI